MSDEGMGRPIEAYEERWLESVEPTYGGYKFPYDEDPQSVGDEKMPLNMTAVAESRMRGMSDEQLSRVVVAAGIMFQESSEEVGMIQCLFVATEMERRRQ